MIVRWQTREPVGKARIIVGYRSANDEFTTGRLADLLAGETWLPGATIVPHFGIWRDDRGNVVREPGASVEILNTEALPYPEFREDALTLARHLAVHMRQTEVIVEMSDNGSVTETLGISGEVETSQALFATEKAS